MPIKQAALQKILMVCIIVLLVTNILLTIILDQGLERFNSCQNSRESLPCQAIPTRFVMEEPECANKLLRSMNVTNVRILPADALDSLLNKTTLRFQNVSQED